MNNLFANKYIIQLRIIINYCVRKDNKPQLGRWIVNHDVNDINLKVDLANEDHCGSCGKYAEEKQKALNDAEEEKQKALNDEEEKQKVMKKYIIYKNENVGKN